jgi:hypothetical protein
MSLSVGLSEGGCETSLAVMADTTSKTIDEDGSNSKKLQNNN